MYQKKNSFCSCGSGKRYKKCCDIKRRRIKEEEEKKIEDQIDETIKKYEEKQYFKDYSKSHFLRKSLLENNSDFIFKYKEVFDYPHKMDIYDIKKENINRYFKFHFISMLGVLEEKLGEEKISKFVKNQLSAGKDKFNSMTFFQALSEMLLIRYLLERSCLLEKNEGFEAIYEPSNTENGSNPEVRLIDKEGIRYDIEVKTPVFKEIDPLKKTIKLNMILSNTTRDEINKTFENKNIEVINPDVLKLKDYIKSAAKKFLPPSEKQINILVVNWTFSKFREVGINEPLTLLNNPITGLFTSQSYLELGITEEEMNKISAIVFYRDNINTITFSNFDHNIFKGKVACVINELNPNVKGITKTRIENIIGVKSEDLILASEWFPISTFGKKFYSQTLKLNCLRKVLEILEKEIELLDEDKILKDLRRITLKGLTKIVGQNYQN